MTCIVKQLNHSWFITWSLIKVKPRSLIDQRFCHTLTTIRYPDIFQAQYGLTVYIARDKKFLKGNNLIFFKSIRNIKHRSGYSQSGVRDKVFSKYLWFCNEKKKTIIKSASNSFRKLLDIFIFSVSFLCPPFHGMVLNLEGDPKIFWFFDWIL